MTTSVLLNPYRHVAQVLSVGGMAVPTVIDAVQLSPPSITSQVAVWWANDLALSDGAAVSSWVDRVGSFDAAQATGSRQPIYRSSGIGGHPAVDFDGTDDILRYAAANAVTTSTSGCVLAVVLFDTVPDAVQAVWASSDEATIVRRILGGPRATTLTSFLSQRNNDTTDDVSGDDVLSSSTAYMLEWSSSGTAYSLRRNNDPQSLTVHTGSNNGDWFGDTANRDNFTLGARQTTAVDSPIDGKIALLIVANAELSSGDRTLIYDWVSDYYGITMV